MADEDVKKQEDSKTQETDKKTSTGGFLQWIIMAVVVAVCAGAGLGLGRLFAGSGKTQPDETSQHDQSVQTEGLKADAPEPTGGDSQKTWYYDLEPVVANLNEPGATRYVRATLILEISSEVDKKKGAAFLEAKKPLLTNWLTIYLASLSIEEIRGNKGLNHIQSEVLDAFNENLFPDDRPQIKKILFKEFAVQ
jgi:flagellar basal body-associated protein FliL